MAYKRVRRTYNDDGVFFCDATSDIANLPGVGHTKIGSKAFVAETSQQYILSKSGWKPVESLWGGGSGDGGSSSASVSAKELPDGDVMTTSKLFDLSTGFYYGLAGDGDLLDSLSSAVPSDAMAFCTVIDSNGKSKYANVFVAGNDIHVQFTTDGNSSVYVK